MTEHSFGGDWTEEKLDRLRKYLEAYSKIMNGNPRARFFQTTYLDAFAGSGFRKEPSAASKHEESRLFDEELYEDGDGEEFRKGSAAIALEVEPGFDRYIFIERNEELRKELESLGGRYPHRSASIQIEGGEANQFLQSWCGSTSWYKNRAVVFLDPYGMEVEWATLEKIAGTKAIDLWVLFPLGQAVNRLLTRDLPPGGWARRLDLFFGTSEWKKRFYRRMPLQVPLFPLGDETDSDPAMGRVAKLEDIGDYFIERLSSIFEQVSKEKLALRNSRNVPIYLLCFAAGAKRGAETAVKIANSLLKQ